MSELRSKAINIKVTPEVHEFLSHQAERRGVTMSSMCALILGEWKAGIEDKMAVQKESQERAVMAIMEYVGPQMDELINSIEESEG
jgi:hypothetical protein